MTTGPPAARRPARSNAVAIQPSASSSPGLVTGTRRSRLDSARNVVFNIAVVGARSRGTVGAQPRSTRRPRASASAKDVKTSIAGSDDWSSIAIGGIASLSAATASRTTGPRDGSQTASASGPCADSTTAGDTAPARTTPAATLATAANQRTESLVDALVIGPAPMSAPESHFGAPSQSRRIDIGRIVSPPAVRTVTDDSALIIIGGTAHGAMRMARNRTGDDIVVTPSQPQMWTEASCHDAISDAGDAGRLESQREPGRSPAVRPPNRATPSHATQGVPQSFLGPPAASRGPAGCPAERARLS